VLPCWWNLTLGNSTLADLQTLAISNFNEAYTESNDGEYILATQGFQETSPNSLISPRLPLGTAFWFHQPDNKLSAIGFNVGYPDESQIDYSPYMPDGILSRYGKPDEATITLLSFADYDINLKYDDIGLYLSYKVLLDTAQVPTSDNGGMSICNDNIANIRIWLQNGTITYSPMMQNRLWEKMPQTLPSEDNITQISNLSLDDFTLVFSQPDSCFSTLPINQWTNFLASPTPTPVCNLNPMTNAELITAIQTANSTPTTDNICLAQNGTYTLTAAHIGLNGLPVITSNGAKSNSVSRGSECN
jgi:hypothetical protein